MAGKIIPSFITRDPAQVVAECKAFLEERLGREILDGQEEQELINLIAYREVLLAERFNAGASQMLTEFAQGDMLDYLAQLVSIIRLPASTAGCTLQFTLVAGHGNVTIPEGTRVSTSDGTQIFETVDDLIIASDVLTITVKGLAQIAGKGANGYAIGTVNKILDPYAFVSKVTNTDVTGGGSDVETDEQLRARMFLAPSQYSTAGPKEAYKFFTMSANPLITTASVSSPIPGTVVLVPHSDTQELPDSVLDEVFEVCNADKVRPLTDTVIVERAVKRVYDIRVHLTLYAKADVTATIDAVTKALQVYADGKRKELGQDIVRSHISQTARVASVYDVEVAFPTENIVIADNEYPECEGIIVEVTGTNNG